GVVAVRQASPDGASGARSTVVAVVWAGEGAASNGLIIRLIIQTIRLDPSGSIWIDEPFNLSSPDPSGADQFDAEHQSTDLAVGVPVWPWIGQRWSRVQMVGSGGRAGAARGLAGWS